MKMKNERKAETESEKKQISKQSARADKVVLLCQFFIVRSQVYPYLGTIHINYNCYNSVTLSIMSTSYCVSNYRMDTSDEALPHLLPSPPKAKLKN
jgi:hypothetical protein